MKRLSIIIGFVFCTALLQAQEKVTMAFPITDYILEKDSVSIVQVLLPEGLEVKEKTLGILKKVYSTDDTSVYIIGTGRCQLIKGRYLYYGLKQQGMKGKPAAGNLIYTQTLVPGVYQGVLLNIARHAITLKNVEDNILFNLAEVLKIKTPEDEKQLLEQLGSDVRFTGVEMIKQGGTDPSISTGPFSGKTVFVAMKEVTQAQVEQFLKYIIARPDKYAGNSWKFSEIMATWMFSGAPTVIE